MAGSSLMATLRRWQAEGRHPLLTRVLLAIRHVSHAIAANIITPWVVRRLRSYPAEADLSAMVADVSQRFNGLFHAVQVDSEILKLAQAVREVRPSRMLEIGTARGGTLWLFTRCCRADATIISIDLPGGAWGGGYPSYRSPWYRAFALPAQRIHLLRCSSQDPAVVRRVREICGDQPLDFLFIDGDHAYEGVKRDFELYSPLVRSGGLIAFHDINEAPGDTGGDVPRYWNEVKAGRKLEEFIEQRGAAYGIGLIRV